MLLLLINNKYFYRYLNWINFQMNQKLFHLSYYLINFNLKKYIYILKKIII